MLTENLPPTLGGKMKILKIAALLAIASLPLLLVRKEKSEQKPASEVESEHIFDEELSVG